MNQEETENKVSLLTTELYYDLLDKYVKLQLRHEAKCKRHERVRNELLTYKQFNIKDPKEIKQHHNSQIKRMINIVRKNHDRDRTIQELLGLLLNDDE